MTRNPWEKVWREAETEAEKRAAEEEAKAKEAKKAEKKREEEAKKIEKFSKKVWEQATSGPEKKRRKNKTVSNLPRKIFLHP